MYVTAIRRIDELTNRQIDRNRQLPFHYKRKASILSISIEQISISYYTYFLSARILPLQSNSMQMINDRQMQMQMIGTC